MADDELDNLYAAPPAEFTALRTTLAAAAKKRGESDVAKRISAARKPTTAAWIVNALVHNDVDARARLTDLGEQLRSAHAAMDGELIRQLSAQQRRLVDALTRAAFDSAGVNNTSAALRDDVVGTLQAAVADPEVTERLGHLVKAERWSGFGGFGDSAAVLSTDRTTAPKPTAAPARESAKTATAEKADKTDRDHQRAEARRQIAEARGALTAAERTQSQADQTLAERQSDLATARLRHDDARRRLDEAERGLKAADAAYADAKRAVRDAAAQTREAKAGLKRAGGGR